VTLDNGLRLHVASKPATGLLAIRGRVDAGTVFETKPGIAVLAADLMHLAAREAGAPPIVLALDDDLAGGEAARFLEFHGSGLPEELPLFARALSRGFAADISGLEEARARAVARAQGAEADTEALLVARARATLFPKDSPLARSPGGSSEAFAHLKAEEVSDFLRRFLVPARAEVSVAGPVEPREVQRVFESAFAEARPRGPTSAPRALPTLGSARGPAEWRVTEVVRPDASQNQVHVVVPGDRSRPHDRAATSLLLYLLGETFYSGRLGRALVEPGLVYSVWTTLEEPKGLPGYLLVRTATSKESTPEVLKRIREVLEGAVLGAFTEAELQEAKTYLRGKAARSGDGALATAARAFEGATADPSPQALTLEQVNDTARRLFANGAPLALVGGPGE
jgi:zinc protease